MKKIFKQTFEYTRFVARRFVEDRCLMVAGSLTYTSLLALVPVFAVTITLTARVPLVRDFILQVKTFILKNFLPDVAGRLVGVYMEQFAQNAARLTAIGLIMIVATAIALMFTIDGAFNHIWRSRQRRAWWKRLLAYMTLLTLGPLLIGASLSVTSYVVHWSGALGGGLRFMDDWSLTIIPFALTSLALVLAYRLVPSRYVPARHAIVGGVFAALLFEFVKHLFVAYVMRVPTYNLVYGAFASMPIFLLWLFCCWMVVLIGAEVAATLSYFGQVPVMCAPHVVRGPAPAARLRYAMRVVDALAASPVALPFNALRLRAAMPIDIAEDTLQDLLAAEIVMKVHASSYQLGSTREEIHDAKLRAAVGAD